MQRLTSLAAALVCNCCKCVAVLEVLQCCSFGRQSCSFAVLAMQLEPSLAACLGSVLEVSVWRLNSCSRRQEPMPGRATLPCSCGMLVLIGKFATLQCWSFGRQSPKFVLKTGLWWNFCSFGNLAWEVSQCQARGCSLATLLCSFADWLEKPCSWGAALEPCSSSSKQACSVQVLRKAHKLF